MHPFRGLLEELNTQTLITLDLHPPCTSERVCEHLALEDAKAMLLAQQAQVQRDAPHASWVIKNKKPKTLSSLKLSDAYPLMYMKRRPYAKERLRSPCAP